MFIKKYVLMNEAGEGGASGGNDLAALQKRLADIEAASAAKDDELERLRVHSAKLLDEKKKLSQKYSKFDEVGDPEVIVNMLKQFENNEDAKLVAEGKFNEVLSKHTQRLTLDYESKLEELMNNLNAEKESKSKYKSKYYEAEAGHAIRTAAVAAGVRESAVDDILLRSKGIFQISDDGALEARLEDGTLRVINGKPLTPDLFVASLKDKFPHYWPDSQSGGANGGNGRSNKANPFKKGSKAYNLTEQAKLRRTNPDLAKQLEAEANA